MPWERRHPAGFPAGKMPALPGASARSIKSGNHESSTKDKHRPDSQGTTSGEENYANPADSISVEGPEADPISVGRQIAEEQPDDAKDRQHPPILAIFTLTGADVSRAESCHHKHRETGNGERNARCA